MHLVNAALADAVEALTDVHEVLQAVIRSALADEALATGLKGRIADMQDSIGCRIAPPNAGRSRAS
jgi:hypothetical protein